MSQAPPFLDSLSTEERSLEQARLGRRQPRRRERLHNVVSDLSLFRRKRRWVPIPAHASADVRVNPRAFARNLVGESMQVAHLLEQRLELRVVDGHDPANGSAPRRTVTAGRRAVVAV